MSSSDRAVQLTLRQRLSNHWLNTSKMKDYCEVVHIMLEKFQED